MGDHLEIQFLLTLNNDITYSLKSMIDDFGRVFFKDGIVYRAINENKKDYCLSLLHSPLFKELSEKKLIPATTVAAFSLENNSLVLEHETLLETLQHEWSFSMLKDAALLMLEVNQICNAHGYELKDAHTLNVLFRGEQPVFIDLGSIAPKLDSSNNWTAYNEFLGSFAIPLMFWNKGEVYITRKLLESNFHRMFTIPQQPIEESGLMNLIINPEDKYIFKIRSRKLFTTKARNKYFSFLTSRTQAVIKKITKRNTVIFTYHKQNGDTVNSLNSIFSLENIAGKINSMASPATPSMWQGYHQKYYSKDGLINYSNRFKRILQLIKITEGINSVIDLAGNEGYLSQLLSNELNLKKIILADYDENAVEAAYQNFKKLKIENVHTVLLNFMFTPDLRGTAKRLQSDLAIALAVTHHLILTANFSLASIFERLQLYSKNYVMVEFMPLGLWAIGDEQYPAIPEWYRLEWFRNEFIKYFDLIAEEQLEENRILFFGKKYN